MRMFKSPRPGRCASCEGTITSRPIYRMDESYCCVGCVAGGPCVCDYEVNLAEDGVDNLGLPFGLEDSRVDRGADQRVAADAIR